MREGLAIVVTPGGGYWPLPQIGWLRRVAGDEWEIVNARVLKRAGTAVPLADLAADGLGDRTSIGRPSKYPVPVHRLTIRRVEFADPEKWAKECPRPSGWENAR